MSARNTAAGRAVVLGGTGFVGRHVCAAFEKAGWEVLAIARHPAPGTVVLDVAEQPPAALADLLTERPAQVVVNAAGSYWGYSEDMMYRSFVALTEHVLAAVAATNRPPRLIQLGTVMEYALTESGAYLTEQSPIGPTSGYGRTKLAATNAVLDATAAGTVDALVLRVTNSVGPGAHRGSLLGKVAHALLDAARTGTRAWVELAPLRAKRDYLDVRDLADAVVAAACADASGQVVNIGRGEAVSVRYLVTRLVEISGVPAQIIEHEPDPASPVSPGAASEWLRVDPATAYDLLGWTAGRTLDGALRDYWHDLRNPAC